MITDEQIETIAEGQTSCTYEGNGVWVVKEQMKHAIKQALDLNDGESIVLPNSKILEPKAQDED